MKAYPLVLERQLKDRLWGGGRLASFLKLPQPYPERIAESWQVYASNRVLNGPCAGMTLAQVSASWGERLLGSLSPLRYGLDFPLLAKFIDSEQDLSIQVHPDDAYAHRVEAGSGFHGKNEAWYILDAGPGAEIVYHLARPVTREQFQAAVGEGALLPLLHRQPVRAGEVVFVPAGILHSIGAGVTLFEIQQKSDLTYRVYDYGRLGADGKPRPLHLDKALDVIAFDRQPPSLAGPLELDPSGEKLLLVACRHFAMERWRPGTRLTDQTRPSSLEIMTLTAGSLELSWRGGSLERQAGESVVLPASLGDYEIVPRPGLELLRCYVPDLDRVLKPALFQSGHRPEALAGVVFDH